MTMIVTVKVVVTIAGQDQVLADDVQAFDKALTALTTSLFSL